MSKSIKEQYMEKGEAVRKRYHKLKNEAEADERLAGDYKRKIIQDAKEKALEEMAALRLEMRTAKNEEKRSLEEKTFFCSGVTSKSDYLTAAAHADAMTPAQRQAYVRKAAMIGADDHVRGVALSAYIAGDNNTFKYIRENGGAYFSEHLTILSNYLSSQENRAAEEMFTFALE